MLYFQPEITARQFMDSSFGDDDSSSNSKKNLLPRQASRVLITWVKRNLDHPYPSDHEKLRLINETGLTSKQIRYWFGNARKRWIKQWRQEHTDRIAKSRSLLEKGIEISYSCSSDDDSGGDGGAFEKEL